MLCSERQSPNKPYYSKTLPFDRVTRLQQLSGHFRLCGYHCYCLRSPGGSQQIGLRRCDRSSDLNDQSDWSVVHQSDGHIRPKPTGCYFNFSPSQFGNDLLDERFSNIARSGSRPTWAPAPRRISVERELTHDEYSPSGANLIDRTAHAAVRVFEDPQPSDLGRQLSGVIGGIGVGHPDKDQQARADFPNQLARHRHRCPFHPLNDCSHPASLAPIGPVDNDPTLS
jgi:hypothetical protein